MSDPWDPAGGDTGDEGDREGDTPPPPPGGQAATVPVLTLESETELTRSGGPGGRVIAGIVGVLVLVGGTVFAVSQLASSGPESPEGAVSALLDAASDEDVVGLLAALDPSEREALQQPVEDLFGQLERLEVLDESFSLGGVGGVDVEFADVTFRTEPVRDDLARVYFTGGTVSGTIDGSQVPIGDFVSDTLDRFDADIDELDGAEESAIDDTDVFLVARNGSDGWRVSIGYTLAEAARISAGLALPDAAVAPIGADSPEAAVEGLLTSAAEFDLRSVIARLSPGELGALHDYAGLFIDEAADEMAEASQDVDVSIDDLSLRSEASGDRASVFIDGFAVTVTTDELSTSVSYADECFSVDGDLDELGLEETSFADGPVCVDELPEAMEEFYESASYRSTAHFSTGDETTVHGPNVNDPNGVVSSGPEIDVEFPTLPATDYPTLGITTVRVDGQWFVAPVATTMDGMVAGLEALERSHLDAIVDFFEEQQRALEQAYTPQSTYASTTTTTMAIGGGHDPVPGQGPDRGQVGPVPTTTAAPSTTATVAPPDTEPDTEADTRTDMPATTIAGVDGQVNDPPVEPTG